MLNNETNLEANCTKYTLCKKEHRPAPVTDKCSTSLSAKSHLGQTNLLFIKLNIYFGILSKYTAVKKHCSKNILFVV